MGLDVKKASIIGGGPTGLALAKALLAEGIEVQVFERRPTFGGVWNYPDDGPMYRDLETNITIDLMEYNGFPFPEGTPQFCDRKTVLQYVQDYSEKVGASIRFETDIVNAQKINNKWVLTDQNGGEWHSDFLVVASGHFDTPYFPDLPGLDGPGDLPISHSRYYKVPEPYTDKKVLVVGNGPSGADIAIGLLGVTDKVLVSRRRDTPLIDSAPLTDDVLAPHVTFKVALKSIDKEKHIAHFTDGSNESVDAVLFCTGYKYTFSFLDEYAEQQKLLLLNPKRERLHNLYLDTVYIGDPSVAFTCANKLIVPMPMAESQGSAIARLWSGRIKLPPLEVMLQEEHDKEEQRGAGASFEVLGYPRDYQLMKSLVEWAEQAGPDGFFGEKWGPEKQEKRSKIAKIQAKEFERKISREIHKRQSRSHGDRS